MSTVAIVLAAGSSQRMGQCKAALPWQGQTLLTYQLTQCLEAGVTPIAVLGPHNAALAAGCPAGSHVVINPDPSRGKVSSLLMGLTVCPDDRRTLMISAVDQPRTCAVYIRLIAAHHHAQAFITLPVFKERRGHPLLLAAQLRSELHTVAEATQGLRGLVQRFQDHCQFVEFQTPEVLLDLNTPEQYRSLCFKGVTDP